MKMIKEEYNNTSLIPRNAIPKKTQRENIPNQRKGFFRIIGVWLGLIKDYTADDINRLKEAFVEEKEANARYKSAESENKIAEAAERHANAEKLMAEKDAIILDSRANYAERMSIAIERLSNAIITLKMKNGDIAFDEKQLLKLIIKGSGEFPDDDIIADSIQENYDTNKINNEKS